MKTKTKLIISFIVMIFLLLFLSITALNNFAVVSGKLDEIYKDRYQKLTIAYDLRSDINMIGKGITTLLTNSTEASLEKNEAQLSATIDHCTALFATLESLVSTDTELSILRELKAESTQYIQYEQQIIQFIHEGKIAEAVALRENTGVTYQEKTVDLIDDLTAYHRQVMEEAVSTASEANRTNHMVMIYISIIGLIIGFGTMLWNLTGVTRGLNHLSTLIQSYAKGTLDLTYRKKTEQLKDEFGVVSRAFYSLADDLEQKTIIEHAYNKKIEDESWVKTNTARLSLILQNEQNIAFISQTFIEHMVPLVDGSYGGLYIRENLGDSHTLRLQGAYAPYDISLFEKKFELGEGLVGQCARSGHVIEMAELPPNYVKLRSGIGEAQPSFLLLIPVLYQQHLLAVIELASFQPFNERQRALLSESAQSCGIALHNLFGRIRIENLLRDSQALSEELQVQSEELFSQQEELRNTNEQLEEQTRALRSSEELLQSQQEELERSNTELQKKAHLLEVQIRQTEKKNEEIEKTKVALEKQAVQLALSSKYKSEFLANMSHELRTPLNSLLILSQILMDNKERNLTDQQLEFAKTIHSSGGDLLLLIDEILDLSKIGAGKMELITEPVPIKELLDTMNDSFTPLSQQKNLTFTLNSVTDVPKEVYTDGHRVKQILKNLLSNAFKFTHKGEIRLTVRLADKTHDPEEMAMISGNGTVIAFEVHDTGIGIPQEKQQMIFEAFQQVDGTTSRIYGGTGLGLSISRELSMVLGGTLAIQSTQGVGSTFTLYLPEFHAAETITPELRTSMQTIDFEQPETFLECDRKHLLLVEQDTLQRTSITEIIGHDGVIITGVSSGHEALEILNTQHFDCMVLDLSLPDMNGFELLDSIRNDEKLHNLPIIIYTGQEIHMKDERELKKYTETIIIKDVKSPERLLDETTLFLHRAIADLPEEKRSVLNTLQSVGAIFEGKSILIVDDDIRNVFALSSALEGYNMNIHYAENGKEAISVIEAKADIQLILMDMMMPEMDGYETMQHIRAMKPYEHLPIIAITAKAMKEDREKCIEAGATDYIAKPVHIDQLLSLLRVWLYK